MSYPLSGICDSCQKSFMSRNEDAREAETEVKSAFDKHMCEPETFIDSAARIVKKHGL
jgi:hypothetical protein